MIRSRASTVIPSSTDTSASFMLLGKPAALLNRYSSLEKMAVSSNTRKKMPSHTFQPERDPVRPRALNTTMC